MGMLTDKYNEDFDRRIEIAEQLGIPVHSPEMLQAQAAEKRGDVDAYKKLSDSLKQVKDAE